ncbi:hypothetical protein ACF0H5_003735 [Mactra antiquata]
MRFSFYSKKGEFKAKKALPVVGNLTQGYRTTSLTNKTFRQSKYAKYNPKLRHDHGDNTRAEHDYSSLCDNTMAITKKNRSEHMRILALFVLNGPLGTWKPATMKKEILKSRGELNFIGDMQCYEITSDLSHCLVKQARLFHKVMEKEFGHQQLNYFHNAWKRLKSRHTSLKTDKHKIENDTERDIVEQKLKINTSGNERSNLAEPSFIQVFEDDSEVCDKEQSSPKNGTRKKSTFISAGACGDSVTNTPLMKCYSNLSKEEKLGHHLKEQDHVQRDSCNMSRRSKCQESKIKIFRTERFGSINERHCHAVSELVNDRLLSRQGNEICCFIQDNISNTWEWMKLKLHLTQVCLESFLFPLGNKVQTSIRRDLYDFFLINVFMPNDIVKDIFGVKHNIEDIHDIDLLLLVPCKYASIFRHRRLCFLDTLSTILGSSKDKLLIIKI